MTDYFYDMDLVVDPLNPSNVVANGLVSIYDPEDTAGTTLLALKDPSGLPLPNPLPSNAHGFLPPRSATVPQTMWKSGGFTGYFNSYKGLRDEAVGAVAAAQTAANSAASAANEAVTTAAVDGAGALVLTKASGATVNAGNVKGATGPAGPKGDKGADGANVLPTDTAIQQAINDTASATRAELNATYVPKWKTSTAYLAGDKVLSPNGDVVSSIADHTSGATFNAANWNLSANVSGKLDKTEAAASYAPLRLTLNPASFPKLRYALSRVRGGLGDAKILCVGDSTTSGIGSNGTAGGTPNSYPYQLAGQLNSYIPSAKGLGIPPSVLSGNPDSRWTAGTGWSVITLGWGEGADYQGAANAAGSLVYADPAVTADRFDVYYATNSGLGTITAVATGGSTVTQSTSAAGGVGKMTLSAATAATTNTVTFTNTSAAAVHILGVEPWNSAVKRVRVGNAGVGSSTSTKWVQSASTFGGPGAIRAYAPDLTIISLGINDATNAAAVSTVTANIQILVDAAKVSGDVLVMAPFPSSSSATANQLAWEPQYAAALKAGATPYLDLYKRFGQPGDNTTFNLGMMNDPVHPNAYGYADLAQLLTVGIAQV